MSGKTVKHKGISVYAPGSIGSMVLGIIGFLVVLYPIAAALLGVFGLFLLFLVVPLIGAFFGLLAIMVQSKTRKYLKRRSLARGAVAMKIGMITGIVAMIIGCSTAGAYLYIIQDKSGLLTESVSKTKVYMNSSATDSSLLSE